MSCIALRRATACAALALWVGVASCGSDVTDAASATGLPCGNLMECAGSCVDTRFDPSHCGGCGVACDAAEVCSEGMCASGCPAGLDLCGSRCVDTLRDESHCGECGAACSQGELCSMGACALACGGGTIECAGRCVDTDVDPEHCGACGVVCDVDQVCSEGACALKCSGGTTPCGQLCVNTSSDPAHCGACNVACGVGQACASGSCGPVFTQVQITVAAVYRGWWTAEGNHIALNNGAFTGRSWIWCNAYFAFDLASVTGLVVGAKLRLEVEGYFGTDPFEPISVWDVTTSATFLEFGDASVATYTDLMSGSSYGGLSVLSSDAGQIKELSLNATALGDIQAGLGGMFSVGLHADDIATTTGPPEGVDWSNPNLSMVHELVITVLQ